MAGSKPLLKPELHYPERAKLSKQFWRAYTLGSAFMQTLELRTDFLLRGHNYVKTLQCNISEIPMTFHKPNRIYMVVLVLGIIS